MITLEPPGNFVSADDCWKDVGLSRAGLSRFANAAQAAVGLVGGVEVLLAGDSRLRRLNRQFRGKDKATDVLSFPAAAEFGDGHAGDLAVSLETAQKQAEEHGHSLGEEVRVLMLHGMLHLAGFDHETDAGEMAAREAELRVKLRLPSGLIARVSADVARRHTPGAKAPSFGRRGRAKAEALAYLDATAQATTTAKATAKAKAGLNELGGLSFEVRGKTKASAEPTAKASAKATTKPGLREFRAQSLERRGKAVRAALNGGGTAIGGGKKQAGVAA